MNPFDAAAALVVAAAFFGYLNYRLIKLPHTIGLTVMGAVASLALVAWDAAAPESGMGDAVRGFLSGIDFHAALMEGMLSFLLFAGALHVDFADLAQRKWTVAILSTLGVLTSTLLVGGAFFWVTALLGLHLPLIWCFVFGALISPTDPVAVLGILKQAKVPPAVEATVAGESLFNDGIGVVVFSILLTAASSGVPISLGAAAEIFLVEAVGGAAFGLVLGWAGFALLRSIDEYNLEIMITLAMVMGGYALAQQVHVSGPVAMAVAGLVIGNHGMRLAMSDTTRGNLTTFWSLIDELLNSVLFLLIGLEVLAIAGDFAHLAAGLFSVGIVLAARAAAVGLPVLLISVVSSVAVRSIPILIWGGLRGGISIALALSLPEGEARETILTATYVVVLFSVVIQGTTVGTAAKRLL